MFSLQPSFFYKYQYSRCSKLIYPVSQNIQVITNSAVMKYYRYLFCQHWWQKLNWHSNADIRNLLSVTKLFQAHVLMKSTKYGALLCLVMKKDEQLNKKVNRKTKFYCVIVLFKFYCFWTTIPTKSTMCRVVVESTVKHLDSDGVSRANVLVLCSVHLWSWICCLCAWSRQQVGLVEWTKLGLSTFRIRWSLIMIAVFRLEASVHSSQTQHCCHNLA